ncbi:MAG: hypothetical protein PUF72_06840 [Clostridiales bacterium]|nr:hypothetical protein [Clostridiales bacterium]
MYKLFDDVTPLSIDCGLLCSSRCCKGDDSGMFLFPGEEEVYKLLNPDWIRVCKSDFCYTHKGSTFHTPIAMCNGHCSRFERPLACRIFPLTPYIDPSGNMQIITDPRAKGICRLAQGFSSKDFEPVFVKNIERTFRLLMKNPRIYSFMKAYSSYLDEFARFF